MFPYIIDHGIPGLRFTVWNDEGKAWYDPLKPYTLLEYEWVKSALELTPETIIVDAGCHHGNYSIVFKPAFVIAIDCVPDNVQRAKENLLLNGMSFEVKHQTLGEYGANIPDDWSWQPDIYKCDIEGDEFKLIPHEIDRFPSVHTWIIEIHPRKGSPDALARALVERGYELLKVDRERMIVRDYKLGEAWPTHATLIGKRIEH
jgi:hypothetical protein